MAEDVREWRIENGELRIDFSISLVSSVSPHSHLTQILHACRKHTCGGRQQLIWQQLIWQQ
ncbi:MAG: hypothetical protein F6K47_40805 [Symploca sp. SIO2E6]|nr:hypothetical protein [Symploca sp. SIO2E6]